MDNEFVEYHFSWKEYSGVRIEHERFIVQTHGYESKHKLEDVVEFCERPHYIYLKVKATKN